MNYQVLQGNHDSTELLPYRIFTTFGNSTLSQRSRRSDFGIVLANVQDVPPEIAILAFDSRSQIRDSQTRSPRQASALDPVVSDLEYGHPLQFCSVLGWRGSAQNLAAILRQAQAWLAKQRINGGRTMISQWDRTANVAQIGGHRVKVERPTDCGD